VLAWLCWAPIAEPSYGAHLLHPIVTIVLWYKLQSPFLSKPELAALAAATYLLTLILA
jgi:hypothetical protein